MGYIVSGFNDHPELVPILTAQHGWVLLDDKGGCSRKPAPYQLQYNIAAWNRICNGDKCFTLTYMSQEDGR